MRTYPIKTPAGALYAFEVPIPLGARRSVCRRVSRIPGVTITRTPKALSWWREESFCEFSLDDVPYEIVEPYGDNSRYWIGPLDGEVHDETMDLIAGIS